MERYPGIKSSDIPARLLNCSKEELERLEKQMCQTYGFQIEEVQFIMRYKPTFVFKPDGKNEQTGMAVLENYFVKTLGFDMELVRALVVKYPYILSKTPEQIEVVFKLLGSEGKIKRFDALQLVFECPKLLSVNLES